MVFGQGHFETFDGMYQRMCGPGDFILMNTTLPDGSVVTVQGRFYENVFPEIFGKPYSNIVNTKRVIIITYIRIHKPNL